MPVTRQAADGALRSLASKDLLVVYEHEGKPYLYLTRWHERTRQAVSRFPDPKNCKVVWQMTGKCQSDDRQMTASPPSPTPSPSPTPTPTPVVRDCPTTAVAAPTTGVCVSKNETVRQKDDFHLQNRLAWFKDHLSAMFRRPNGVRMSYEEECCITEIARRPDSQEELRCIERWKSTIPSSKLRFFPQSMGSLLRSWDETLDKARCKVDMSDKVMTPSIAKTNLDRILRSEGANP